MDILIIIISIIITVAAQSTIKSRYNKYSNIKLKNKITGAEIAREILDKNDLSDIFVIETGGELTDHYDPKARTIRLSKDIYRGETIASAAVAAHEVGHVLQEKASYGFYNLRRTIVPMVNFVSTLGYFTLLLFVFSQFEVLFTVAAILMGSTLAFHLITLPVEFDASKRAQNELASKYVDNQELKGAEKMLKAAAFTYVASLIANILQLIRVFSNSRRR